MTHGSLFSGIGGFDLAAELFVKDFDSVIREEAEGFGEYLRKGRWVRNDDTTWIKFFFELGPEIKTTAELYDEYTKTKEK